MAVVPEPTRLPLEILVGLSMVRIRFVPGFNDALSELEPADRVVGVSAGVFETFFACACWVGLVRGASGLRLDPRTRARVAFAAFAEGLGAGIFVAACLFAAATDCT